MVEIHKSLKHVMGGFVITERTDAAPDPNVLMITDGTGGNDAPESALVALGDAGRKNGHGRELVVRRDGSTDLTEAGENEGQKILRWTEGSNATPDPDQIDHTMQTKQTGRDLGTHETLSHAAPSHHAPELQTTHQGGTLSNAPSNTRFFDGHLRLDPFQQQELEAEQRKGIPRSEAPTGSNNYIRGWSDKPSKQTRLPGASVVRRITGPRVDDVSGLISSGDEPVTIDHEGPQED